MMYRNTVTDVRHMLEKYTHDDDVHLEWTAGANDSPIHDGYPAELKVKNADGGHLASLFLFEKGIDTVLEAFGTTLKDVQEEHDLGSRHPQTMRVRRTTSGLIIMRAA